MGIPSYFSFILKNYGNIISRLKRKVDNLYLDSNSIIYDSLRKLEGNHNFENLINVLQHKFCLCLRNSFYACQVFKLKGEKTEFIKS